LSAGLAAGLFFGLSAGMGTGLAFGFSGKQLIERLMLSPNEGIRRSLKNGLVVGLLSWLVVGLLSWPFLGLGFRAVAVGVLWLFFGLFSGLIFGLFSGLGAATQHYTLRFWLACSRTFP